MVPPPPTANGRVSRGASRTAVVWCPAADRESGPAPNRSLQFCFSQRMLSSAAVAAAPGRGGGGDERRNNLLPFQVEAGAFKTLPNTPLEKNFMN